MNKKVVAVCAVALGVALALDALTSKVYADEVVLTTLFADGSTNTWTQADLVAALQLLNRKYHRDVSTASGRAAWHGKKVAESVDTNTLTKVTRYEDGTSFTDAARIITPAETAQAQLSKLPKRTLTTNGVPTALAAARQRVGATNVTVNVVIRAGQ